MNRLSPVHCETLPGIREPANVFIRSPINTNRALVSTLRPIDSSPQRISVPTGPGQVRTPSRSRVVPYYSPVLPSKPPTPCIPSFVRPLTDQHSMPFPGRQVDTASAGAIAQILDTLFRPYKERIQAELSGFGSACAKAIFRESREKEKWKSHCVTFKQERDAAREQLRSLMKEKQALQRLSSPPVTVFRGTKRRRVDDDEPFKMDVTSPSDALYDSSPASALKNPPLPPLRRSLEDNPEALDSPSSLHMPVEIRAKRPRRSAPELAGCRSREPTPEGHLGEADMDLGSEAEASPARPKPNTISNSAFPSLDASHIHLLYSSVENRWVRRPCVFQGQTAA